MLVTVMADASFCPHTKMAGYGYWIASNRGKQGGGSVSPSPVVSSIHSEICAIVEAVKTAIQLELVCPFDVVLIQSDCMGALNSFQRPRKKISKCERSTIKQLHSLATENNLRLQYRHVKGHSNSKQTRNVANNHCDKRARDFLSIARQKVRENINHVSKGNNMTTIQEQQQVIEQLDKIIQIYTASEGFIRPHFLLTGPSGSGKSYIAQNLAGKNDVQFIEINAAQLTKEGTSGNSLSKALSSLTTKGNGLVVCFVDEFDKLFISGNNNSELAHETTNGVQNEFLKVLESKSTAVFGDYGKYVDVAVDKVLFIFAGAFNGEENLTLDRLRDFNIKTEFLGRVGLIYNLQKLSLNSMYVALQNSTLLAHYLKLFPDVDKTTVVNTIMKVVEANHEKNTLGIRMLNTLLNQYFINGGNLGEQDVKQSTFQKTLSFTPNPHNAII